MEPIAFIILYIYFFSISIYSIYLFVYLLQIQNHALLGEDFTRGTDSIVQLVNKYLGYRKKEKDAGRRKSRRRQDFWKKCGKNYFLLWKIICLEKGWASLLASSSQIRLKKRHLSYFSQVRRQKRRIRADGRRQLIFDVSKAAWHEAVLRERDSKQNPWSSPKTPTTGGAVWRERTSELHPQCITADLTP